LPYRQEDFRHTFWETIIGYHESVHAGQFLAYLRAMELDRPRLCDWRWWL